MSILELFVIAVGLSMDAFAVAICKGLSVEKAEIKHCLITGLYFGGFQALMPLIGFFLGEKFQALITRYDHWIAFVLLALIGGNMIKESLDKEQDALPPSFDFRAMLPLAVATSIDALAVGVTFAFLQVNILWAVALIGVTTFAFPGRGSRWGISLGRNSNPAPSFLAGLC